MLQRYLPQGECQATVDLERLQPSESLWLQFLQVEPTGGPWEDRLQTTNLEGSMVLWKRVSEKERANLLRP